MANNNPISGISYLLQGIRLLLRPKLRRYLIVPLLVNILVFGIIGWVGYSQFTDLLNWLLPESSWLSFIRWLLWPLFALATLLVIFFTFTAVANLIAAPFNALLAERVELILTGKLPSRPTGSLLQTALPAILSELRKIGYFLLRATPLILLFLIPGINIIASLLWLAFNSWFLTLEYIDYPMGNSGVTFSGQLSRMREMRSTSLSFGWGVNLLMMVPLLNFVAMPAAVAGATAMWCSEKSQNLPNAEQK